MPSPTAIASGLSEAQRQRLREWPEQSTSLFRGEPDKIAQELCELGIGTIMPWKHGKQMGLKSGVGLAVHKIIMEGEKG